MKKLSLLLCFVCLSVFSFAFTSEKEIVPVITDIKEVTELPAEVQKLSINDFLAFTPEKYTEMTGEKLGIANTFKLKAAQKIVKKNFSQKEDIPKGLYILAVILGFGFIVMGIKDDWSGKNWWMNLILTALCWIPGVIHGLVKMKEYYK